MTAHRTPAGLALALAVVSPLLLLTGLAAPAQAHGALDNPVSRVVACGPDGGENAQSTACRAAVAVSGALPFTNWDNLRVSNVGGRDREVIPDGKLCSGGLPAYKGLDLPRADWPATRLTAGAGFGFTYRETIPHKGTFRLYVTREGYDPTKPLKWSDLEPKPFLTATDPALTNGAYRMRGTLPAGRTGRHLIYTIWQNSSTPDTYYSCSDVIFAGGSGGAVPTKAAPPAPAAAGAAGNAVSDNTTPTNRTAEAAVSATSTPRQSGTVTLTSASSTSSAVGAAAAGAAVLAVVAGVGGFFLRRRRR
ncbi:MAG TPA: lytic polysaccharide monooxygenase [Planosporangium sp.]|nr:lytic polysaccharide monooxygenase [Planosporangium sp.]